MEHLQYPVGRFVYERPPNASQREAWIDEIRAFPALLQARTARLGDAALGWKYRPGGWNIRQLVHHCADSHLNAFIRFKLALTENGPTVKPYFEDRWATLPDMDLPLAPSLNIVAGVHARWAALLEAFGPRDWERTFVHPEHGKSFQLQEVLGLYAWHGRHHLAHIGLALEAQGKHGQ